MWYSNECFQKCMDRVRRSRQRLVEKFRNLEVHDSVDSKCKDEAMTLLQGVWQESLRQ